MWSVLDKLVTKYDKIFQLHLSDVATLLKWTKVPLRAMQLSWHFSSVQFISVALRARGAGQPVYQSVCLCVFVYLCVCPSRYVCVCLSACR